VRLKVSGYLHAQADPRHDASNGDQRPIATFGVQRGGKTRRHQAGTDRVRAAGQTRFDASVSELLRDTFVVQASSGAS
jgi:hypothetical protein